MLLAVRVWGLRPEMRISLSPVAQFHVPTVQCGLLLSQLSESGTRPHLPHEGDKRAWTFFLTGTSRTLNPRCQAGRLPAGLSPPGSGAVQLFLWGCPETGLEGAGPGCHGQDLFIISS